MRRGIQTIVGGVIGLTWWSATALGFFTWTRLIGEPGITRAREIRPNGPWTYRYSFAEMIASYALTIGVALLVVALFAYLISKVFRIPQLDLGKLLRGLLLIYVVFLVANWIVDSRYWQTQVLLSFSFLMLACCWSATTMRRVSSDVLGERVVFAGTH